MQPAILAFLGVAGGLPAGPLDPGHIPALVRDLDAYRFAERDRAAKHLIALGPAAVAPLKKALAADPSPEFARQAGRVLHEIRRRSFSPGPASGGFRATLRVPEESYPEGADITIEVEVQSVARA